MESSGYSHHLPVEPGSAVIDTLGQTARVVSVNSSAAEVLLQLDNGRQLRVRRHLLASQTDGSHVVPFAFADLAVHDTEPQDASVNERVIPVIQEELQIDKRLIDTGKGVRVHQKTVEREQVVDEPLRRDEVVVTHVPRGVPVDPDHLPAVRQEGDTLIVPVLEQVLVIDKRWQLTEEIHITRHQRDIHAPQTVTLASRQVTIERFDEKPKSLGTSGQFDNPKQEINTPDNHVGPLPLQESIMANTLVGVYDNYSQAQGAYSELIASGFDRSDLQLSPSEQSADATQTTLSTADTSRTTEDHSFGSGIRNFFHNLFGGSDDYSEHADVYSEAVRRGHYLLTVNADNDEESEQAMQVMNRFNPIDVDERAAHWKSRGWSQYDEQAPRMSDTEIEDERRQYAAAGTTAGTTLGATAGMTETDDAERERRQLASGGTTEGATIPVIQEELQVGKREVERGGVRVYQRVKETPVDESVRLREEHVHVERHAVNQPASEADLAALKEGSFEMRETAEEAVIGKTARVVEEVVIGKETTERTENIHDTVRRTDVEVEQLGASSGAATGATSGDDEYRRHFQTTYGTSGDRYEDYAQAYRYGSTQASDDRYRGYRWDDAEPNVRRDWESRNAGTPWEKAKDAVRYGWEKMTR